MFSDRELNSSYGIPGTIESKSERLSRPEICNRDLFPTGNVKLGIKRLILDMIVSGPPKGFC